MAEEAEEVVLDQQVLLDNHRIRQGQDLTILRQVVLAVTDYHIPILERQDCTLQVAGVLGYTIADHKQVKVPTVVTVVRSVTGVADKMVGHIVQADRRQPILAEAGAEDGDTAAQPVPVVAE